MTASLPVRHIEAPEVVCGETEASCRCDRAVHADPVHRCACGGSWQLDEDGTFTPLTMPGPGEAWDVGSAICAMFGITDEEE